MKKIDTVRAILKNQFAVPPKNNSATAYAPSNIALVKYWGKRNQELNLPVTSSLSVSLKEKGAEIILTVSDRSTDHIILNGKEIPPTSDFYQRFVNFINLFRAEIPVRFVAEIKSTVPVAAGLASSACGFASIVLALNKLFAWNLAEKELSVLARLGSGSAARSIWQGFVEWHAGSRDDGLDSFGEKLNTEWTDLGIGILLMTDAEKSISSRKAMQHTVDTSPFYATWPATVAKDLQVLKSAIEQRDFHLLGKTAESNAMAMHATMLSARPSIIYSLPETIAAMKKIWQLRAEGLPIYFTQDAGPNLKLLFLQQDFPTIQQHFFIQ